MLYTSHRGPQHPAPLQHLSPCPMCLCVAPFKCLGLSPGQFSLKEWLMPVYFRKAKPFPRMGGGDCRKGKKKEWEGKRKWRGRGMKQMYGWFCLRWPASWGEREIIRSFYIVSKGHVGSSVDLSRSAPRKESKCFFSSRMYSVFIKQWITDIPLMPCGYCFAAPPLKCHQRRLLFKCWLLWVTVI